MAIVGRPNVGKSTLFNRILGGRPAIVSDRPGTTRDRHFGDAEWQGRHFWLVDTGGLVPDSHDSMDRAIRQQVEFALDESDLVVFLVDGKEGVQPVDRAIAERLRAARVPGAARGQQARRSRAEHRRSTISIELGLGDPFGVSAAIGKGSGDLLDAVVDRLPPYDPAEARGDHRRRRGGPTERRASPRWSIGCSARSATSSRPRPAPRATRSTPSCGINGKTLNFIDTAGLRRRAKVEDDLEFYSTLRTERAIERAQVCVLVVDAAVGLHNQDLRIATEAWEQGCGLIVVVNKWDLVEEKDANTAHRGQEELIAKAPFLRYVPFVYVSALTGQRVRQDARPHPRGGRGPRAAGPHRGGQPGAGRAPRPDRAAAEAG